MTKTNWPDLLRAKIQDAGSSRETVTTPAMRARLDAFAEKFAAAMGQNAAETERGIAIIEAHAVANGGTIDFDELEKALKTDPSDTAR
jgi:hypothetical protein